MPLRHAPSYTRIPVATDQDFDTPQEAHRFLLSRNWVLAMSDAETGEDFYSKNGSAPPLYPWHEAVAMEFIHFITLGGGQ